MSCTKFIMKDYLDRERPVLAERVVDSKNCFDHGSGRMENMDEQIRNLNEILGLLIGVLVDRKLIGDEEIKQILGRNYSIGGPNDG